MSRLDLTPAERGILDNLPDSVKREIAQEVLDKVIEWAEARRESSYSPGPGGGHQWDLDVGHLYHWHDSWPAPPAPANWREDNPTGRF